MTVKTYKGDISDHLKSGVIINNEFGDAFLPLVREWISPEPVFGQIFATKHRKVLKRKNIFGKAKEYLGDELVNELDISVYVHGFDARHLNCDGELKKRIISCFEQAVQATGQNITYDVTLEAGESRLYDEKYGKGNWDIRTLPIFSRDGENSINVTFYSFDAFLLHEYLDLAMLNKMNKLDSVCKVCAQVNCGWDEDRGLWNVLVVVSDYYIEDLTEELKKQISSDLLEMLKKRDVFGIFEGFDLAPMFIRKSLMPEYIKTLRKSAK